MEVRTVELAKNDIILLFTDGVTEGRNPSGEMFGQERLCESLARYARLPLEKTLQRMLEEVREFQVEQEDDMTLILLKRSPQKGRREHREMNARRQERTRSSTIFAFLTPVESACWATWSTSPRKASC